MNIDDDGFSHVGGDDFCGHVFRNVFSHVDLMNDY